MQRRDDRIGRLPAIRMARAATAAEARLIRSELAGLFGGTLRVRKAPPKSGAITDDMAGKTGPKPRRGGLTVTVRRATPAFRAAKSPAPSAERCNRALAAAVAAFGAQAGRAFLNEHHRGLNGPPLEMAATSSAGLRVVEAAIAIEARRRGEGDAR